MAEGLGVGRSDLAGRDRVERVRVPVTWGRRVCEVEAGRTARGIGGEVRARAYKRRLNRAEIEQGERWRTCPRGRGQKRRRARVGLAREI